MLELERRARVTRLGRRVGLVIFGLVVSGITAVWSVQIIRQVWAPAPAAPNVGCKMGVLQLFAAVHRARTAAALEPNGERAALKQFRDALLPEWNGRRALDAACRGDKELELALRRIDALRYAEEHAVRYEGASLSVQRREANDIGRELMKGSRF